MIKVHIDADFMELKRAWKLETDEDGGCSMWILTLGWRPHWPGIQEQLIWVHEDQVTFTDVYIYDPEGEVTSE